MTEKVDIEEASGKKSWRMELLSEISPLYLFGLIAAAVTLYVNVQDLSQKVERLQNEGAATSQQIVRISSQANSIQGAVETGFDDIKEALREAKEQSEKAYEDLRESHRKNIESITTRLRDVERSIDRLEGSNVDGG